MIHVKIYIQKYKEGNALGENKILIYQDENCVTKVGVRFSDEDIWLTQQELAEIYDTTQQNIVTGIMVNRLFQYIIFMTER